MVLIFQKRLFKGKECFLNNKYFSDSMSQKFHSVGFCRGFFIPYPDLLKMTVKSFLPAQTHLQISTSTALPLGIQTGFYVFVHVSIVFKKILIKTTDLNK